MFSFSVSVVTSYDGDHSITRAAVSVDCGSGKWVGGRAGGADADATRHRSRRPPGSPASQIRRRDVKVVKEPPRATAAAAAAVTCSTPEKTSCVRACTGWSSTRNFLCATLRRRCFRPD